MTQEQKIFVETFQKEFLIPLNAEADKYLARTYRVPRYKLYCLLKTVKFDSIGEGGFRIEFIFKRKKVEALYVAGKSTADMEFALEILKNAIEGEYFGYSSEVLFKSHPIPRFYRGIVALQSIVSPSQV